MEGTHEITVVICTRDRAGPLRQTLECLAQAYRSAIAAEIRVVDNNSRDGTRRVVEEFRRRLPIRYLTESREGKDFAMNRALDAGNLGEITVFLDDDMSVHQDWFAGVKNSCDRWPGCDIFGGRNYVVWPEDHPPAWALRRGLQPWAFSILDQGNATKRLRKGEWPMGGHFWVRSQVFERGYRFRQELWPIVGMGTEPELVLRLRNDGYDAVYAPEAVAGHRIQRELLCKRALRRRAFQVGRMLPHARLPYPRATAQGQAFAERPLWWGLLCGANVVRWAAAYLRACLVRDEGKRFERQGWALIGLGNNYETLRRARQIARRRSHVAAQSQGTLPESHSG